MSPAGRAQEFFLQLVRGRAPTAGWPPEGDVWEGALTLAQAHGVAPLLHAWAIGEAGSGSGAPANAGSRSADARLRGLRPAIVPSSALPQAFVSPLHRMRAAELLVEARREAALVRALAALASEAASPLPVLLLKGAASARTLYVAPELRPRGDLDLLVAPAQFAEAVARLEVAGYRHHPKVRGTAEESPGWHERTLLDPADPSCVLDLHQELLQPERQGLRAEAMLARSQPAPGLGANARLPAPEDALLSCVVSLGAHELRSPLVVACDLALLLGRCDPIVVAQRAAEARVERMLLLALSWLQWLIDEEPEPALCGVAVDRQRLSALSESLQVAGPIRAALRGVAARYDLERQALGRAEQLVRKGLLIDRPWDAVRFASATLRRQLQAHLDLTR
jgi:hypothetical protein